MRAPTVTAGTPDESIISDEEGTSPLIFTIHLHTLLPVDCDQ